ncbi:MAG: LysR family transcriptional regulator [Spirochaetia bacterium]|nr:LysR family transcriptional regulator [Spirochaetia bacterium]
MHKIHTGGVPVDIMDIRQLKYFVTVVDTRSFSKAAQHLFVSQSTLSKSVQSLQSQLGITPLLYFSGKQMYLTSQGTELYMMAKNLLSHHDAILDAMNGYARKEKGVIKIGIPPVISTCVFPELTSDFVTKYPGIEFAIDQQYAYKIQGLLEKGVLEIGFTLNQALPLPFEVTPIFESKYVVIVHKGHPLAARKKVTYQDLHNEKFIIFNENYIYYNYVLACCHNAGFEPKIYMRFDNWDLIVQLVKIKMGISILPYPLIQKFPTDGIATINLDHPANTWQVVMISQKDHFETIAVKTFKNYIKDVTAAKKPHRRQG